MEKQFEYINHLDDITNVQSVLVIGKEDSVQEPLVSVIMPVYNHPDFFKKSLLSVVNQKCNFNYEIVIVDNKHQELQPLNQKIIEEVNCDKVRYYINSENIGGVGSENRGLQLAKGKYITYCHDDDLLYEDAIQNLINEKDEHPEEECAIFGAISNIDQKGEMISTNNEWDSLFLRFKRRYKVNMYDFLLRNYSNGCGALYNRERLLDMGGFNKDYIPSPDYALNVYYTMKNGAYAIKNKTLKYRISEQGDSSSAYVYLADADRHIKKSILQTGNISCLFPSILIKANLECIHYHLYKRWDKESPSTAKYFLYRLLNRCWIYGSRFSKMFR